MSVLLIPKIMGMLIMLLIGFLLRKANVIGRAESKGLSVACLYVALPCSILMGFQREYAPEITRNLLLAFLVVFLIHGVFLLISWVSKRWLGFTVLESVSIAYPNCGNLVIPLVSALLGNDYVIYSCVFITVQAVFLWSHAASRLSGQRHVNLVKVALNPNIWAFIVGLAMFFSGARLTGVAADVCSTLGNMTGPLPMLVAGILLGELKLPEVKQHRRLPLVLAVRLVAMPAVMALIFRLLRLDLLLGMDPLVMLVMYMSCCTPMASTVVQMAQLFRQEEAPYAGMINALGILLCIVTIPLMVALYQL